MHLTAAALILVSAIAHVYWNLEVKRSPEPAHFGCLVIGVGAVLLFPLALAFSWPPRVPPVGWACVAGTGTVYAGYYALIGLSYRRDDLSRAYPIARGVAPAATAELGLLLFREQPTLAGWLGIGLIVGGVLALAVSGLGNTAQVSKVGIAAAIGTGLCTAAYSAVDKVGVRSVSPALYLVLTSLVGSLAYGAMLWRWRGGSPFLAAIRVSPGRLVAAAVTALGGYLLVLYVLQQAPVSYVVPLRSVSVLLSVLVGSRLLGEKGGAVRLVAAGAILAGISAIALGG